MSPPPNRDSAPKPQFPANAMPFEEQSRNLQDVTLKIVKRGLIYIRTVSW